MEFYWLYIVAITKAMFSSFLTYVLFGWGVIEFLFKIFSKNGDDGLKVFITKHQKLIRVFVIIFIFISSNFIVFRNLTNEIREAKDDLQICEDALSNIQSEAIVLQRNRCEKIDKIKTELIGKLAGVRIVSDDEFENFKNNVVTWIKSVHVWIKDNFSTGISSEFMYFGDFPLKISSRENLKEILDSLLNNLIKIENKKCEAK